LSQYLGPERGRSHFICADITCSDHLCSINKWPCPLMSQHTDLQQIACAPIASTISQISFARPSGMASGSPTTLELVTAAVFCTQLLAVLSSGEPLSQLDMDENDRVHDFLRVLDRTATYRPSASASAPRAATCYCSDNPFSCLRQCMPTTPTARCGATYDVFSTSASFSFREGGGAAGSSGEGAPVSRPT
jgi:hypothetical protein